MSSLRGGNVYPSLFSPVQRDMMSSPSFTGLGVDWLKMRGRGLEGLRYREQTAMGVTVAPDVHAAGVDWWNARFADVRDDRVSFSMQFLPALLKASRLDLPTSEAISLDELRVVAKYCVADSAWQHDTISLTEFIYFLARFGPLEVSLQRLVESFTVHRELVTWFHGAITRAESERLILSPNPTSPLEDGSFIVRFSDSQPTRFCLSYLKIHTSGPHAGRRETRNVLMENVGQAGFALTDSKTKAYPSIRVFIQRSAARLKYGIPSLLSRRCNQELAAVRAHQDLVSNSYTTFSTDSLDPSSTSAPSSPSMRSQLAPPSSYLFSKSPQEGSGFFRKYGNNQEEHLRDDDNYSGFAMSSLLSPPLQLKSTSNAVNGAVSNKSNGGYGSFSSAAVVSFERTPPVSPACVLRKEIPIISPPIGSDYGDFSSFTSGVTSFSRVIPPRRAEASKNDEYANFESFLPVAQNTARKVSGSTNDGYGSFDSFELNSSSVAPKPLEPTTDAANSVSAPRGDKGDDYGSFAALAAISLNESHSPLGQPPPAMVPIIPSRPAVSDTYGAFSFSPQLVAQKAPGTSVQDPPQAKITITPPKTDPSDTYGSFDAVMEAAPPSPRLISIPHSAPANLDLSSGDEEKVESKMSALDELNMGMEFYKQKQLDDALLRFIRARETAQQTNDQVVEARALGNLGTIYLDKENPQQAVKCYQQCLEITRSIQDVKRERTILNNLVLALKAAEDFESAYNYCQVQLEMTVSEVNRRKILSRMSELRERAARASREARMASIAHRVAPK